VKLEISQRRALLAPLVDEQKTLERVLAALDGLPAENGQPQVMKRRRGRPPGKRGPGRPRKVAA
jgi:hypothetical protein